MSRNVKAFLITLAIFVGVIGMGLFTIYYPMASIVAWLVLLFGIIFYAIKHNLKEQEDLRKWGDF